MAQLTDQREPIFALYYGTGGTGKTTAMAGMAHLGRILVINAENGIKARPLRELGVPVENIETWPEPGESITYESLEREWLRIREELHADPDAYVGIAVDSITELQALLLNEVRASEHKRAQRLGKAREEWALEREDYRILSNQMIHLMRGLRDLPCHLAITALERRDQDPDGAVRYGPAAQPAVQTQIYGWAEVVCWTTTAEVQGELEFRGRFAQHGKYDAKDRYNAIPHWLVNPSFDRLVSYIEGDLAEGSDGVMEAARKRALVAAK